MGFYSLVFFGKYGHSNVYSTILFVPRNRVLLHLQNYLFYMVPLQREPQKKQIKGMKNVLANRPKHLYNVEEIMEAWISVTLMNNLGC